MEIWINDLTVIICEMPFYWDLNWYKIFASQHYIEVEMPQHRFVMIIVAMLYLLTRTLWGAMEFVETLIENDTSGDNVLSQVPCIQAGWLHQLSLANSTVLP